MKLFGLITTFAVLQSSAFASDPIATPIIRRNLLLSERIINGNPAATNQFPYQVNIFGTVALNSPSGAFCGGSLIGRQWVLTAAHCVSGLNYFKIRCGSNNYFTSTFTTTAIQFFVHPGYNRTNLNNDIAVIKLKTPVTIGPNIRPINFVKQNQRQNNFENYTAIVSGWGLTSTNGSVVANLRYVLLRIISNVQCKLTYGSITIQPSTVCTLAWSPPPPRGVCSGDSGGPLVISRQGNLELLGVISFTSSRGCASGDPSGYVRTTSFMNWISSKTGTVYP